MVARTMRNPEWRSPSKLSTTSTRCSIVRGPAMEPSLVTWPTISTAMLRFFATRAKAAVTSRTCAGPPGVPSAPVAEMVCTESTISSDGETSSTCPSTVARSFSLARKRSSWTAPVRAARSFTCEADSSPEM